MRLNKAHDPILPGSEHLRNHSPSVIGSFVERVKSGCDVVFLATGSIASEALAATKLLAESGIACSLYTVPCVKPIDSSMIFRLAGSSKLIVTVEEHSVIGGLGSAVGELLLPMNTHAPILAIGIPDCYPEVVGDQTYLRHQFDMDAEAIARRSLEMLGDL